jgi:predicted transposase YbfD/YdcC
VALIRRQKQHYLIKVKANEKKLFKDLQQVCSQGQCLDISWNSQFKRGRQEHRKVELYPASKQAKANWCDVKSFIRCTRWGKREGHAYERVSYYISDLRLSAYRFDKGIRSHWSVENNLHWVKDAVFKEDKSKIRNGNGPEVMSLLRGFAIKTLAQLGNATTQIIRMLANKPDKILQLLE